METATLRLFVRVARLGSLAAAARAADLDASSVSRTIAALEEELGVRLFNRSTRRLALTEAGETYLRRIEPLLEQLESAAAEAGDRAGHPEGRLRIAVPVSYGLCNVVPLLPGFSERFPAIELDLLLVDSALDLVAERIDVAIRLGPRPDLGPGGGELVARRLEPMRHVVCASPTYVERHGSPASPEALANHSCLLLDAPGFPGLSSDVWRFTNAAAPMAEVVVHGPLRTSNALALRHAALGGVGIANLAEWIIGPDLQAGTLIDLFPGWTATPHTSFLDDDVAPRSLPDAAAENRLAAWVVYHSKAYLPLKTRVFIDFLVESIRTRPLRR